MYTATVFFEKSANSSVLARGLQQLPEIVRPIYFSEDERGTNTSNLISEKDMFESFLSKNPTGFFLHAEGKTLFDISRRLDCVEVTLYLAEELPAELILELFGCLAKYQPIFGFGCSESEYFHRNRYYITIGKNHIEDWVGRKLDRYIPGVYWCTLLSDQILDQHRVSLSDLSSEAVSNEVLGESSLHLLKFYSDPENWQENTERLDRLCERIDGIFSKRAVESAVEDVSNYMEYDEIIAGWR